MLWLRRWRGPPRGRSKPTGTTGCLPLIEGGMQMRRLIGMPKAAGVVPKASAEDEWCLSAAPARSLARPLEQDAV